MPLNPWTVHFTSLVQLPLISSVSGEEKEENTMGISKKCSAIRILMAIRCDELEDPFNSPVNLHSDELHYFKRAFCC